MEHHLITVLLQPVAAQYQRAWCICLWTTLHGLKMALAQRLGRTCALHPVQCRVVAGLRRCSARVGGVPAAHTAGAQKRTLTRVNVALVSLNNCLQYRRS